MTRHLALILALVATGCIDPDFEPASRVSRPRVLAIVADRPEIAPGEDARLHAVVAGADDATVEVRYWMCLGDGTLAAGGFGGAGAFGTQGAEQFGGGVPDPGCDPRNSFTTPLVIEDGHAVLPGACPDPAAPWQCTAGIASLFSTLGSSSGAPPELVERIVDTVGVAVTVSAELWVDGALAERAFKRVALTRRASPTINPPPPRFAVGDVWMSARGGADPHDCVPERGERPVVSGLAEVRLRPDPGDVDWIDTFPVVSVEGELIEGRENAFYSWFSTAGEFDPEISVAPERDTIWLSPDVDGVYPLWVVVRDGHLGTSACRAEVEVQGVVPPYTGVARR